MNLRLASLACALVTLAAVAGCSSASSDANDDPASEDALAGTSSHQAVSGSFKVKIDRHLLAFDFQLGSFDLERKTAKWNAKLTERGGMQDATDDVNVAATITQVARCPGCFTVEVPGGSHADLLARVTLDDWKVTSLVYEGEAATLTGAPTSGALSDDGSPDDVGACTQSCSGNESCKAHVRRGDCASATGLFPVLRCPTTYTFAKGGTCAN